MAKRDYYEILGVGKTATKAEIKKAYRKLAKEKHPDRNKSTNAEAEFKEIQEAYEILNDESKRKAYDQFGHAATDGFGGAGGFSGFGGTNGFGGFSNMEDLSDIFSQFFGDAFGGFGTANTTRRGASLRGADIEATLRVDFEEAVFGKYKTINYKRKVSCDVCKGTGAQSSSDITTCSDCQGRGSVSKIRQSFLGTIQTTEVCPTCAGQGKVIAKKCKHCLGEGRLDTEDSFRIKIPPGIPDGVTLRFRDRGNAGKNGGSYGDLYITIEVEPHPELERRGDDIYSELTIDASEAALGGEAEIETVRGPLTIKIPAGTQHGKIIRLSDKGGPKFRGDGNGDHYIKINVHIPEKLNRKQRELWEQLRQLKDHKPGFFG